jgi:hypothetical protein
MDRRRVCAGDVPGRQRDLRWQGGVHGIITDLTAAGYIVKQKDGRRNRYQVQAHLPLPEPWTREPAIAEILTVLLGDSGGTAGWRISRQLAGGSGGPRSEVKACTVNAGRSDALASRTTRAALSADPSEGEPRTAAS